MEAGQELAGRYRLDKRLGAGGMGEVWAATDLSLDRPVAVKLVHSRILDAEAEVALARFRREGRAAARLSHPHIAVIHDVGAHGTDSYLVMELLRGPDLRELLRGSPGGLPVGTALEYGAQAAEGLAAAHEDGVVHRDVKPDNLLLDRAGRVKVCDFGIAALEGATTRLTTSGHVVGTIAYMAPEQLRNQPATGAIDVYALGVTLFRLITGRPPFPGGDVASVITSILMDPPPAPSTLRPGISPRLDAYLLSMLAKEPGDRPAMESVPAALRDMASVSDLHAWAEALLAEAVDFFTSDEETFTIGHVNAFFRRIASTRAIWDEDAAERYALDLIPMPGRRAGALTGVAEVVAEKDRSRAVHLLTAAIAEGSGRDKGEIAAVMALLDPAEAERIVRSMNDEQTRRGPIDDDEFQARAFCTVAKVLGERDPSRSRALAADAEQIIRRAHLASPHRSYAYPGALAAVATCLSDTDPRHALGLLAEAERVARSQELFWRDMGLRDVAVAMAFLNPVEAQRVAKDITDTDNGQGSLRSSTLVKIAAATAPQNPDLACSIAYGFHAEGQVPYKVSALIHIALVLAGTAPDRAAVLLADAERQARTIGYDNLLARVGQAMALIDPAGAESIALALHSSPRYGERADLLSAAARVTAERDPERADRLFAEAERLARLIQFPAEKAEILVAIVARRLGPYPQSLAPLDE